MKWMSRLIWGVFNLSYSWYCVIGKILWILLKVSHGLYYNSVCCFYQSFPLGYLVKDRFACLFLESIFLIWGLLSKWPNGSWSTRLVMGEFSCMLLRRECHLSKFLRKISKASVVVKMHILPSAFVTRLFVL